MTITDTSPGTAPAIIEQPCTDLQIGAIAPGEPTYLVADNPWKPWATRAGLTAIGSALATIATIALASPLAWWALATFIATALLFAFLLAGHELTEKRPTSFKKAP